MISVEVTHIGEDYGKVEVCEDTPAGVHTMEFEVELVLAEKLREYLHQEAKK